MKKIALVLVAAMVLVFTGCEKKETISMPFDVADVNNIEMYRNAEPYSAEKQVITESEDIADLYSLFSGLEVSDKKTEPVVGETITSFRFNLSDDTSYEIIYCAEAVKSGRLKFPAEKLDYFTSADIGGRWDSYQYEIVPEDYTYQAQVSEQTESYRDMVEDYCEKYGIDDYVDLCLAVIEQESGGNPPDVMQTEQSYYNVNPPIDTVEESIDCGLCC